jgi:hypothetical protein
MLPTLSLSMIFEALDPVHIPGFSGSVWRGAFGYALKRVACVMKMRPCEGCPLESSCVYTTLFDTRPVSGEGLFTATARAPHPFALGAGSGLRRSGAERAFCARANSGGSHGGMGAGRFTCIR